MITIQQIDEMIDNPREIKLLLLYNGYSVLRAEHMRRTLTRLAAARELMRRDTAEDVNFGD
jgi:hypothetical protein